MDTVKTYPCPCCGASLGYDGSSKSLHCASCGNDYTPETLQQIFDADSRTSGDSAYDWNGYEPRVFGATESEGLRTYTCPACGAEITGSQDMGATICPYCGNAAIVEKQFEGSYEPDYIVPFRWIKKQLCRALRIPAKNCRFCRMNSKIKRKSKK